MRAAAIEYAPRRDADVQLAVRHAQGDETAFDEVYARYSQMVFSLALRLTGNPDDAADLHQEAFLRVYRYLGRYKGRSSLKTWVYSVSLNAGRTLLKRRARLPRLAEDESLFDRLVDPRADPQRRAVARQDERRLQRALTELPAKFRVAVVLRDIEGMSYQEIAEVLRVRVGTVRSRIARGRQRVRRALEEER